MRSTSWGMCEVSEDEQQLLDDLLAVESGLTAWEMDFIESLDRQRARALSPKQREVMGRIADKVGLGGLDVKP
jgi:hypothetical protein